MLVYSKHTCMQEHGTSCGTMFYHEMFLNSELILIARLMHWVDITCFSDVISCLLLNTLQRQFDHYG